MSWELARAWLPFAAGTIGGAAVVIGVLLGIQAGRDYLTRGDGLYALVVIVCAAIVAIGGVLVILNAMEVRT